MKQTSRKMKFLWIAVLLVTSIGFLSTTNSGIFQFFMIILTACTWVGCITVKNSSILVFLALLGIVFATSGCFGIGLTVGGSLAFMILVGVLEWSLQYRKEALVGSVNCE